MSHPAYSPERRHTATPNQLGDLFEEVKTALWLFGAFGGLPFGTSSREAAGHFYGFRSQRTGWSGNLPLLSDAPRFSTALSLRLVEKIVPRIASELCIRSSVRLIYAEAYFDYGRNEAVPPSCCVAFESCGEGSGTLAPHRVTYTIDWDPPVADTDLAYRPSNEVEDTDEALTLREYVLLSEIVSNWSEYAGGCMPPANRPLWQLPEEERTL